MNRFRQLKTKLEKRKMQGRLIRIKHDLNRFKKPRMKVDMIQTILNQVMASQKVYMIRFRHN